MVVVYIAIVPVMCDVCYSVQRYKDAERWCSMGMKFLKFLSELKPSYEDQVTNVPSLPPSLPPNS